ncbi:MAG: hypothetical protein HYW89_02205 [Candidatus Sungiibacteriota bacterium]|uniref:Uncharacterized protein n=1 Tax=Candidatus Sungiibacteriota bacterium TaxID=2750080 RepID=A0A7T5USI6_9BACT|nr:MAG: hypothetical protein HYW89_02205 [Candidatus Sungbacteria bacterium]
MPDLTEELDALQKIEDDIQKSAQNEKQTREALDKSCKELKDRAGAARRKLIERIKGGETTGDSIKDLVLVRYGVLDEEREKVFRGINERLKNHPGEFILILECREDTSCCHPHRPHNELCYHLEIEIFLGVLTTTTPALILNSRDGSCALPTVKYVYWRNQSLSQKPELKKGNVKFGGWYDLGNDLDQILRRESIARNWQEPLKKLEIFIGDVEVVGWFREPARQQARDSHYSEACKLLGRTATELPEVKEELARHQTRTIEALIKLSHERLILSAEVGLLYRREGEIPLGGVNVDTICVPDKTNPLTATILLRQQLAKVEENLIKELETAVTLGLGDTPSIKELCRQFEIKLSQPSS